MAAELSEESVEYFTFEDVLSGGGPGDLLLDAILDNELNLVAVDPFLVINAHEKKSYQVAQALKILSPMATLALGPTCGFRLSCRSSGTCGLALQLGEQIVDEALQGRVTAIPEEQEQLTVLSGLGERGEDALAGDVHGTECLKTTHPCRRLQMPAMLTLEVVEARCGKCLRSFSGCRLESGIRLTIQVIRQTATLGPSIVPYARLHNPIEVAPIVQVLNQPPEVVDVDALELPQR